MTGMKSVLLVSMRTSIWLFTMQINGKKIALSTMINLNLHLVGRLIIGWNEFWAIQ